jgi:hypothetical protein
MWYLQHLNPIGLHDLLRVSFTFSFTFAPFVAETLPDALLTGCEKCSEKQKSTSERVINHLMKERGKDWERLLTKFDPKGEYKKRYESLLQGAAAKS